MANLMVRNVDAAVIEALKARADKRGTSVDAEHRRILVQTLCKPKKKLFAEALARIPPVGKDSDFRRVSETTFSVSRKAPDRVTRASGSNERSEG